MSAPGAKTQQQVKAERAGPERVPCVQLTERQAQVMTELSRDGATNKKIGKRMFLSADTVKYHVVAVMAITGCHTRTAVVLWWLRTGRYQQEQSLALAAAEELREWQVPEVD